MDIAEVRALLTPAGLDLLNSLGPVSSSDEVARIVSRLRSAGHSPDLVSAVVTQARLRERARSKFGDFAGRMLFTRAGLEQATRLSVAAHHAGRFRRAGIEHVADLGCGIGGDALALASLGIRVGAIDADEVTAALATVAFFVINIAGIRELGAWEYCKHLTGGAPWYVAILMVPIEILSTFIKPIALALRLFANMTAGHILVATLFMFVGMGLKAGVLIGSGVTLVSSVAAIAIYFLELFVAFLQAFVFMFLTAVFIGQLAHHGEHHDDHAHDHEHDPMLEAADQGEVIPT